MGKNSQLHIVLETSLLNSLKLEASGKGINLSEYCRKKLRDGSSLRRIEKLLIEVLKNGNQ